MEKMSNISPIGQPNPALLGRSGRANRGQESPAASHRGPDQVELSPRAQLLSKIAQLPEVRQDLVDRVRSEIDSGTYDTPEKVDALMDSLLEDLA